MLRQLVQFEHKIEDFLGHFMLPPNTPIPIAKEILCEFLKIIGQIEDQGKAALESQAQAQAPIESVEVEGAKIVEMHPNG